MQKEINKLNKTIFALKSSGEKERELRENPKVEEYAIKYRKEDNLWRVEVENKEYYDWIKTEGKTKDEAIDEALRKLEGKK